MSNFREYRSENQVNSTSQRATSMTLRVPAVARRIWKTLTDAENWVSDELVTDVPDATAGLLITVIGDTEDKNGVYMVQYVNSTAGFPTANYTESGINYTRGHDTTLKLVKVASENSVAGLASLQHNVTATGVTVGNVNNGEILEAGLTLTDIIERIFIKEIMTDAVFPTIKFNTENAVSGISYGVSQTFEIGTLVPTLQLSCTRLTDGYYQSSDEDFYSIAQFIDKNPGADEYGHLAANCTFNDNITYKDGNTVLNDGILNEFTITNEGVVKTISVNSTLSSDIIPNTNKGNPDTDRQITNAPGNANIKFSGVYKYFYGYAKLDNVSGISYETMFNTQAKIEDALAGNLSYATTFDCDNCETTNKPYTWYPDGKTRGYAVVVGGKDTAGVMKGPEGKPVMVIIMPAPYYIITSFNDGAPVNMPENWTLINTVNYTKVNTTTVYRVYMCRPQTPTEQNHITFGK